LVGEKALASMIAPSPEQIRAAKRVLGTEGFIAYITCNQSSEYHAAQAREVTEFARRYGLNIRVYDSDSDEYKQLTLIESARAEGASAILLCPLSATLLHDTLTAIDAANIPLVIFNATMPSYGGVLIAGDEYAMGYAAGEWAGQLIQQELGGQARVIILDYPELPSIIERANGIEDGVLALAPDAIIVGRYLGALRENGQQSVAQLLADGVEFNVIVSINDAGAFGAITALEAAGIPPDQVLISSVDAEALAREYIEQGYYLRGSVNVGRTLFSQTAVDVLVDLLSGATLPERILVPPGEVVTQESLQNEAGN
jgi:ABC-type sugar transport system substrate-binding protein